MSEIMNAFGVTAVAALVAAEIRGRYPSYYLIHYKPKLYLLQIYQKMLLRGVAFLSRRDLRSQFFPCLISIGLSLGLRDQS